MTEAEWRHCTDFRLMLEFLWRGEHGFLGPTRARKMRFAAAAVREPFAGLVLNVADFLKGIERAERGEATAEEQAAATAREVAERARQAAILRDLFGPLLFRNVSVDPAWLTWNNGLVPNLAQASAGERSIDRFWVLADALEEAGCTNADILNHLRGPGPHFRGCFVLDLLLGES